MPDKIERAHKPRFSIDAKAAAAPAALETTAPDVRSGQKDAVADENKAQNDALDEQAAADNPKVTEPAVTYTTEEAEAAQRRLPIWASVTVILAITVVSFWLAFNPEWVMGFGRWGYVGAFIISAVASATIILPAPGIAVVIAMGASLDPIWLGIVAGVGSAFGELTGYIAGASGRAFVPQKQRLQFERLHDLTNRYGALLLFGLAAIPFPLFDFAGIISGMMRMSVALFLVSVSLGKSIKYVIMILVGGSFIHWMQEFFFSQPPVF